MKLLTKDIRKKLPVLNSKDCKGLDALAIVKFFTPDSNWTWYASSGSSVDVDGQFDTDKEEVDFHFFGLVVGLETELGCFTLNELESVRGVLGLPVERDRYYTPKTLRQLMDEHERWGY